MCVVVMRVATPCHLVSGYRRFGRTCSLLLQSRSKRYGVTTHKTSVYILMLSFHLHKKILQIFLVKLCVYFSAPPSRKSFHCNVLPCVFVCMYVGYVFSEVRLPSCLCVRYDPRTLRQRNGWIFMKLCMNGDCGDHWISLRMSWSPLLRHYVLRASCVFSAQLI
jgi:hypothetical protein